MYNYHLVHLLASITLCKGIRSYMVPRCKSSIASNCNSVAASTANATAAVGKRTRAVDDHACVWIERSKKECGSSLCAFSVTMHGKIMLQKTSGAEGLHFCAIH